MMLEGFPFTEPLLMFKKTIVSILTGLTCDDVELNTTGTKGVDVRRKLPVH